MILCDSIILGHPLHRAVIKSGIHFLRNFWVQILKSLLKYPFLHFTFPGPTSSADIIRPSIRQVLRQFPRAREPTASPRRISYAVSVRQR